MWNNRESGGLYRTSFEHDSCGFGMICQMDGVASHELVHTAIDALSRLTHRGAVAADGKSGDGCGLLIKLPEDFFRAMAAREGIRLAGSFAVGMVFLSQEKERADMERQRLQAELEKEGLVVAGWRVVPTDPEALGASARETLPRIEQVFVPADSALVGKQLSETNIRKATDVLVIAVRDKSGKYIYNPASTTVLTPDSTLVVLGSMDSVLKLRKTVTGRLHSVSLIPDDILGDDLLGPKA